MAQHQLGVKYTILLSFALPEVNRCAMIGCHATAVNQLLFTSSRETDISIKHFFAISPIGPQSHAVVRAVCLCTVSSSVSDFVARFGSLKGFRFLSAGIGASCPCWLHCQLPVTIM